MDEKDRGPGEETFYILSAQEMVSLETPQRLFIY